MVFFSEADVFHDAVKKNSDALILQICVLDYQHLVEMFFDRIKNHFHAWKIRESESRNVSIFRLSDFRHHKSSLIETRNVDHVTMKLIHHKLQNISRSAANNLVLEQMWKRYWIDILTLNDRIPKKITNLKCFYNLYMKQDCEKSCTRKQNGHNLTNKNLRCLRLTISDCCNVLVKRAAKPFACQK